MYVRLMASAASLALLFQASPAFAAWETITPPRADDRKCEAPHETNAFAYLRASEKRPLRIAGGAEKEIEIYGQLIDLSRDASSTASEVRITDGPHGVAGLFNAARGCGNIGSTKITIKAALVSSEVSGALIVGSERIPIVVVPRRISDVTWDNSGPAAGGGVRSPGIGQTPINCQNGTSTCLQAPSSSQTASNVPDTETLVRCISSAGGRGEFRGNTLTVTLPDDRVGLGSCWTRHFLVDIDLAAPGADVAGGGRDPAITANANGPTPAPTFAEQAGLEGKFGKVRLPNDFVSTLAGDYVWNLAFAPASGAQQLVLRVKSELPYGVASVTPAVFVPAVGRLNSNISPTAKLNQPAAANQPLGWRLRQEGANPAPAACFVTLAGTVTPGVGAVNVPIPLEVREDAACYDRQFALHVAPETRLGDDVIYGRTTVFTLQPLTRVVQPPKVTAPATGVTPRGLPTG